MLEGADVCKLHQHHISVAERIELELVVHDNRSATERSLTEEPGSLLRNVLINQLPGIVEIHHVPERDFVIVKGAVGPTNQYHLEVRPPVGEPDVLFLERLGFAKLVILFDKADFTTRPEIHLVTGELGYKRLVCRRRLRHYLGCRGQHQA